VKVEKANQAEFWAANKKKKYTTLEMIESIAFDDDAEMMDSIPLNGEGGM
jgi:hypothetical protein